MSLAGQLNSVLDRTHRLIELCEALQEENDLLKLENQSLQSAVETGKKKAVEMDEKMNVLKLARSLEGITAKKLDPNEKTLDIKQKISEFVREIDKCIVLLKK
ncbi:hypothetical protein [Arcticibacter eurypsychrophilus]|uniref:hypothetical protein n=1 Tax=Arcticibacter eurypsychrophilus TaxID=1434752 RepID=UPI00084D9517|nr:hypothetical protein [Arcticibacter eurypsychrophilus]